MAVRLVTVTSRQTLKCVWCGVDFERKSTRGPKPRFCGRGHRQRAYEARALALPERRASGSALRFDGAPSLMAMPKIDTKVFAGMVEAAMPKIDTKVFAGIVEAAMPKIDTKVFAGIVEAAMPKIDRNLFIDTNVFAGMVEAAMPKIDHNLFIDTKVFAGMVEAAMPKIDWARFGGFASGALAALGTEVVDGITRGALTVLDLESFEGFLADALDGIDFDTMATEYRPDDDQDPGVASRAVVGRAVQLVLLLVLLCYILPILMSVALTAATSTLSTGGLALALVEGFLAQHPAVEGGLEVLGVAGGPPLIARAVRSIANRGESSARAPGPAHQ
jgi:hypothetical protein